MMVSYSELRKRRLQMERTNKIPRRKNKKNLHLDGGGGCSVAQLCLTLCDPMDCSTPGLPDPQYPPEFAQVHVTPFFFCLQSFPASGSFLMSQLFTSGGQSIGVSASTFVLPMNTQDWSPLGWTGWISLQSKGLSRVFSNTTVQSINSSVLSFLYSPTLTSIHDHWKNHNLD